MNLIEKIQSGEDAKTVADKLYTNSLVPHSILAGLNGLNLSGYVSKANGNFVSDSNYKATDFIPVWPKAVIIGEGQRVSGVLAGCCCYDQNKKFIKAILNDMYNSANDKASEILPEGTAFVRLSFHNNEIAKGPIRIYYEDYQISASLLTSHTESLKSSIINNLDTGGSDKFLSAEQGKVLNEKIKNIDLSEYAKALDIKGDRIIYGEVEGEYRKGDNLMYNVELVNNYYLNQNDVPTSLKGFSYTKNHIEIEPNITYVAEQAAGQIGLWYNANKTLIGQFGEQIGNDWNVVKEFTSPLNARYVRLNKNNDHDLQFYRKNTLSESVSIKIAGEKIATIRMLNTNSGILSGKIVAYYGTSIPAAYPKANWNNQTAQNTYSYANIFVYRLGGRIINKSIASGGITLGLGALSFCNPTGTINYQKDMLDLIDTDNEPDYFVFDYHVNDIHTGTSQFLSENWDFTSEDTNNFIGAYNFIFKQLYTLRPNAKIILVSHFSNDSRNNEWDWTNINKTMEAIAHYWGIPIVPMHRLTRWSCKHGIDNITVNCPDGIHPASANNTKSINYLANIMEGKIKEFLL